MRKQQLPGSQDAFLPRGQRLGKVLLGKKNTAIESLLRAHAKEGLSSPSEGLGVREDRTRGRGARGKLLEPGYNFGCPNL